MDRFQWLLLAVVTALIALGIVALFNNWLPFG